MQNIIYSSLSRRILATIIDSIILTIPHAIVFGFSNIGSIYDVDGVKVHTFSYYLVGIMINVLYIGLFEASKFQGTIGKLVMNIKIVGVNEQTISFNEGVIYFV